jgi:hypothetical protein
MKPIDEYGRLAATASKLVAEILKREGAQAQALFDRITKRHGLPTAKILFERCIKLAKEPTFEEEQKRDAEKHANKRKAQAARALSKLPTLEQIAAANRNRICNWWYQAVSLRQRNYEIAINFRNGMRQSYYTAVRGRCEI